MTAHDSSAGYVGFFIWYMAHCGFAVWAAIGAWGGLQGRGECWGVGCQGER